MSPTITKTKLARLLVLVLISAITLAACTASHAAPQSVPVAPPAAGRNAPSQPGSAGENGYFAGNNTDDMTVANKQDKQAGDANAAITDRIVLKNATLNLIVDDPAGALKTIGTLAEESGGWIVTSNSYQTAGSSGSQLTYGSITIRVPADKLNDALTRIRGLAVTVTSDNVTGEDVTQKYTDLKSQLTNLEAAEEQLRKIMDSTTKPEDVLAVYRELTNVRGQIEVLKGQIKYYDEAASFSSIAINLTPSEAAKPLSIGGWQPGTMVKNAIETLVNAVQTLVDAVIWFAIVVLPFVIPVLVIVWLYRRRRSRRIVQNANPIAAEPPATS
jgi:hypothetical protein